LDRQHRVKSIKEVEENSIKDTLSKTGNNIALTADLLGISKSTLYRKAKMLGINKEHFNKGVKGKGSAPRKGALPF
jgi:DNA-binding NtrC family response regulator